MKCFFVIIVTIFMIGCKSQYDLSNTHYVLILKAYEDTFSLRRNDLYFVTRDSGYFEQRLNESLNIDTVESINRQTFRYNYIKRNKIIFMIEKTMLYQQKLKHFKGYIKDCLTKLK